MDTETSKTLEVQIIRKAKDLGASLAGIADVNTLKRSPSHIIYGKLENYKGVGTKETSKVAAGEISWPENARSVIVIAVEHPVNNPELDWWKRGYSGGTPGNRILMTINSELASWLEAQRGIYVTKLPYLIEEGGIFLKDAAVLAGLGCIGENNMLVTPEFGPRVRLRALVIDEILSCTGPVDFDPCPDCDSLCREGCPQDAFGGKFFIEGEYGLKMLPARTGEYSRYRCNVQMEQDIQNSRKIPLEEIKESGGGINYCRRCEFACPVGR